MINDGHFNKGICIYLATVIETINKISHIGMVSYFITGDNYIPWVRTNLLISFEALPNHA